jgi:hypothetical protein
MTGEEYKLIVFNGKIEKNRCVEIISTTRTKTVSGKDLEETSTVILSEEMEEKIGWKYKYANVKYYISEEEIDPETIQLDYLNYIFGSPKVTHVPIYGSELTGYMYTKEEFKIGGHSLINILSSNIDKYVHLEIELFTNKKDDNDN